MKKRKISLLVVIAIIAALIIVRVMAPTWITSYANKIIDDIPGYSGSIDGVDLSILRGAYAINGLDLRKVEADTETPFVAVDQLMLSVQWKALLDGAVVGEVEMISPDINFANGEGEAGGQFGEDIDWTEPIRELMPIQINRFAVTKGRARFINEFSAPPVDVALESLELELLNLKNVVDKDNPLPSPLKITATSIGGGKLSLNGKVNALRQVPDFDINMKFEGVDLPALNDFLKAYANIDAEKGVFNLYMELAAKDSELEGYVKPIITDLQVLSIEKDIEQPLQALWEGLVGLVSEVLENQPRDQIASRVPIAGTLGQTEIGVVPTLWNLLRNAFVEALKKRTDGSVTFAGLDSEAPGDESASASSAQEDSMESPVDVSEQEGSEQGGDESTDTVEDAEPAVGIPDPEEPLRLRNK